jgi:hypothetical protein
MTDAERKRAWVAKKWREMTPEQRAEYNRNRREKYARNDEKRRKAAEGCRKLRQKLEANPALLAEYKRKARLRSKKHRDKVDTPTPRLDLALKGTLWNPHF